MKNIVDMLQKKTEAMDWPDAERRVLFRLMRLFIAREAPDDPYGMFPRYDALKRVFIDAVYRESPDAVEAAFLALYCHVHGYDAPYTRAERTTLDALGGYWCHAGGISPILKAGAYLRADSVSVDLGAGNGLQGLLMQALFPHRRTIQIELSSKMVAAGQCLAKWLSVPEDRLDWQARDIRQFSPEGVDFIYLYRPMRPEGPGAAFYETLASELERVRHRITIFSVADCLAGFLSHRFRVVYGDGHLTCFSNGVESDGRSAD